MKAGIQKQNYHWWLLASSLCLVVVNCWHDSALSQTLSPQPSLQTTRGEKSVCREQSLESLTTQLMRDLPNYANRASQRGRRLRRSSDVYSYMLVAGRPEFQPLPLQSPYQGKSTHQEIEQVFFTTLARQYINQKVVESQEFHWLLLTRTQDNWRFVMMFTQTGSYPQKQPPSPPRDSSNGTVAQGIKAWLRDCQAGSLRSSRL
ncbi:hypothetical protein Nos7524_3905 [Nostoc sp. PCC 7524]|uniref:hypothetical protein n=1 Tax=Nostoc sp. (strain ATCC 29411 / PCC 7524) TaxID=28072 RepID=UPI00029F4C27|nr:hypothetical protein [Nostoc sp. PCC 7524]AFY49679.1 hypothetical protein Nos7524_3905 [Nostoc sp. PCC 7524]